MGMRLRVHFFLPFFLLCVFGVYYYHLIDIPFFRMDEGWLMQAPLQLASNHGLNSPMLENGTDLTHFFFIHPPMYSIVLASIFKIFGFGIIQARLLGIVFSLLTLVVLYWQICCIAKKPISRILPLLFCATAPLFYVVTKTIRPEVLMLLIGTLNWALLYGYLSKQRVGDDYSAMTYSFFAGIVNAIMSLTHTYGIVFEVFWILQFCLKQKWRSLAIFVGIQVLIISPYLIYVFNGWNAFMQQVVIMRHALILSPFKKLNILFHYSFFSLKSSILILISLALGVISLFQIERNPSLFSQSRISKTNIVMLAVFPILFWIQFLLLPKNNELYFVMLVPDIALLFIVWLQTRFQNLFLVLIVLLIVVNISGLGALVIKYRDYSYIRYEKLLQAVVPNEPGKLVLGRASMYPIFNKTDFHAWEAFPENIDDSRQLKELIDRSAVVVLDAYPPPLSVIPLYLQSHFKLVSILHAPDYGSEGRRLNNVLKVYVKP